MPLSTQQKIIFVIMAAAVAFLAQENNLQRGTIVDPTEEILPFPPEIEKWEQMGKYLDVFGHRMFAVHSRPEVPVKDVVLIVHGFPTSSFDFLEVLPLLTNSGFEVVLVDMLGFGLSDKPIAYSYSLHEQADSVLNAWYQLLGEKLETHRLHIISHDMGDSVTAEILTRLDKNVAPGWFGKNLRSVTINNGGIYAQLANLRISQILLRNKYLHPIFTRGFGDIPWFFRQQIKSILGKKARDILSSSNPADQTEKKRLENEIELMWWTTRHKLGHRRLPQTIGYIDERYKYQVNSDRWNLSAILNRLHKRQNLKVHVVWGMDDSVAPKVMAHRLIEELNAAQCPHEAVLFPDLGHWAMIEDPLKYASSVIALLKKIDN